MKAVKVLEVLELDASRYFLHPVTQYILMWILPTLQLLVTSHFNAQTSGEKHRFLIASKDQSSASETWILI